MKLAEIYFVTVSRSIKCDMKYCKIWAGNLCERKQREGLASLSLRILEGGKLLSPSKSRIQILQ